MQWQAGVFLFTQNYEQDAINSYSAGLISQFIDFGLDQHLPKSALDDVGLGLFGQATMTFRERLDVTLGARFDQEWKDADLQSFFDPALPFLPASVVTAEKNFGNVSPQAAVAFHAAAEPDDLRDVQPGLQGRRLQPVIARRCRGLRRGAYLERRGRMEVDLGRWPCDRECRRLLC